MGACALAQEQTAAPEEFYPLESVPTEGINPLEGPLHELLREELMQVGQPLEGPIDPETYRLGPGDLLGVFVTGDVEEPILARIAADGLLRLRNLGIFDTRDKFLADTREEILEAARKSYKADKITVSILELRNFKASVGGMVWAPGTYNMTAADRVVSLLARAGGFYNPARREEEAELSQVKTVIEREKEKEEEKIPELPSYSARRAQLMHKDGTKETVDVLLFLRAGLFEGNPYLRDGDFLLVPPLNPKSGVLGIYGAVNHQGMVEYLDGDNLETVLLLSGGLISGAMRDSIEITRFVGESSEYESFFVNLDEPGAMETPIFPDDRVYVRSIPDYHPRHQVELRGEFMKPGFYPVSSQGTPVKEIIEAAGGFTERASLKEVKLTRKMGIELVDPEYERLVNTAVSDMKPLEYQYYKNKSRELKGQVVIDLYALFIEGDSTQNVLLRNEDVLEVPPITKAVNVTGQVKNPGIITYQPGKDYKYYIEQSGGFSWNAKKGKIRVIKAISGKWVKPKHTLIEEGDTIFIPERAEIDYWQTYKDIMLVLTQFATLYLLVVTIDRS
jgi:protein involved in polysaccharide export with SLBB domain